jgi:hypothetical protein
MAHFAELDDNNKVIRVIVVRNEDCLDSNDNECEQVGIDYCKSLFGDNTRWIQTSYNSNIRNKYAGIGDTYREDLDVFITPKPFDSWIFDENTLTWEAPIQYPNDEKVYKWNEEQYQNIGDGWELVLDL